MRIKTLILLSALFILNSCRLEHKEIEETYADGSPKRVCVYLGKGDNRELIRETTYYDNKQIQMDGGYKHKKRNGKWVYYHEDGKIWSEGFFINGKSDGVRKTYFDNGKLRYEGNYKEDVRVGKWRFYDENGRLIKEVDYSPKNK